MTWLETIAFALGVFNVTLVVRRSVWNFPFALAMVTLYAAIFWDARLYSDALLQGFFFVVNLAGWAAWRTNARAAGEVVVATLAPGERMTWTLATVAAALAWGWLMHRFTDASLPWWDAAIAAASIAAQVLLAARRIENWPVWIAVDIASIGLYAVKGLWLTTVLYAVFLALAIWGWRDWRRAQLRQRPATAVPA